MTKENATTIQVQVGNWQEEYHVYKTTAPEAYDGHGTLLLYASNGDERWLLIPADTVQWQIGRNTSGLYPTIPETLPAPFLRSKLLDRLFAAPSEN